MTSEVHRVPDRDPEGGPDSPPNPPTRPDPTNTLAGVVCGSSLAEESIHRLGSRGGRFAPGFDAWMAADAAVIGGGS